LSTAANAVGNAAAATGKGIAKGFTAIDNALGEGHADGALTGGLNEHDTKVGLGVIGTMSGVGIIAEGLVGVGLVTVFNGVDDALSNSKGESGLQQMTDNSDAKMAIGLVKTATSAVTGGLSIKSLGETLESPFTTGSMLIDAATVTDKVIEVDLEKLKRNGN
jgi:hypothetical protein